MAAPRCAEGSARGAATDARRGGGLPVIWTRQAPRREEYALEEVPAGARRPGLFRPGRRCIRRTCPARCRERARDGHHGADALPRRPPSPHAAASSPSQPPHAPSPSPWAHDAPPSPAASPPHVIRRGGALAAPHPLRPLKRVDYRAPALAAVRHLDADESHPFTRRDLIGKEPTFLFGLFEPPRLLPRPTKVRAANRPSN